MVDLYCWVLDVGGEVVVGLFGIGLVVGFVFWGLFGGEVSFLG